ncbi:hypothetical protein HUT06_42835 [Actinomadura sp. NAK00032]|uniref:hypothetical protein n=1 Tax=Actinomadura sp. NAK00032 TaxID=2742128 RepID=UPI001590056A|nr:hypothetical protein [Actinomadura sp. NAK00032]QKW39945.1 hypothetical protein HUT06_42835 [Actinomadura sp. NAK00032]
MSVFDLLGLSENDLTSALAFALARCPGLLHRLVLRIRPGVGANVASLRLEARHELGRTDLEIDCGSELIVFEAKRGWLLPDQTQLSAYAPRVIERGGGMLVSLSDASVTWAKQILPDTIEGVPLLHLPWALIREDLDAARHEAHGHQRLWLDELHSFLRRAIKVLDPADAWTYCVAISTSRPGDGGLRTYRDFVVDEGVYFHPYGWGSGWPKTAPNFLAFRWDAHVQQVNRVQHYEIAPNLQTHWPDIPATPDTTQPVAIYRLGPALPGMPIPTGKQYRASRLWVLLDQLLTSPSLAEALEGTKSLSTP